MNYPGAKAGSGSYQHIISELPPMDVFIEGFAGSGIVGATIQPRPRLVFVDIDPAAPALTRGDLTAQRACADALDFVPQAVASAIDAGLRPVVYLDPPYLFETRQGRTRRIYGYEMGSTEQHRALLCMARSLTVPTLISGYASPLYTTMLAGWRLKTWTVTTRSNKTAVEHLWMNYPTPALLHDPNHVGIDYINRQRLRRLRGVELR